MGLFKSHIVLVSSEELNDTSSNVSMQCCNIIIIVFQYLYELDCKSYNCMACKNMSYDISVDIHL